MPFKWGDNSMSIPVPDKHKLCRKLKKENYFRSAYVKNMYIANYNNLQDHPLPPEEGGGERDEAQSREIAATFFDGKFS